MSRLLCPQELEREKHAHSVLQFQFSEIKETLKQSEELLNVSIGVQVCHGHVRADTENQLLGTTLSPFRASLFTALCFICCINAWTIIFSPSPTSAPRAVQEIRQLNMKQEGFVREISDLQETVEWKDKKIGVRLLSLQRCLLFLLCTTLTSTLPTLHV